MSSSGTTNIASNGIVVDVLNRENYSTWKELVKNYLIGNDLWYNIIKDEHDEFKEQTPHNEDKDDSEDKEDEFKEQTRPKEDKVDSLSSLKQADIEKQRANIGEECKSKNPNDLSYNIIKDKGEFKKQTPPKEDKVDSQASHNESFLKHADNKKQRAKTVEEYKSRNPKEWDMKSRRALHAIQLSCGKILGQIKNFSTAKEAWNHIDTSFREDLKARDDAKGGSLQTRNDYAFFDPLEEDSTNLLQTWVKKGFLDDAKLAINISPDEIFFASPDDGRTVLHIAVVKGREEIVNKLISVGKKKLLKMQDKSGYTALALAAKLTDNKDMAEIMVNNGGEELLTITSHKKEENEEQDDEGIAEIPVLLASAKGHKDMTRYLFSVTPMEFLRKDNWKYGVVLLARCISKEIFDVAATILLHDEAREIPLGHDNKNLRPIYALARKPSAFPSSINKLDLWERFIYHSIILTVKDVNNEKIKIVLHEPEEIESPTIMKHTLPGLGRLFEQLQQFVQTSILLKFFDVFRKMHEKKMDHYHVLEILDYLCKRISILPEEKVYETSASDAMLQAAKNGITEFIGSMKDANPDLLFARDESNRGIFAHAILNRQEEVFQLLHDEDNREIITSGEDKLKNNLLHIAAELGPSSYLDRISNAALQMQRELQWFEEVKKVMPDWCQNAKDANGKTADEVFKDEHKELLKSGQQWAKETASSFTIVGTLIITIMFAAAFSVPGGNTSNDGTPIILHKNHNLIRKSVFTLFVIADAVSLVTSSSSVLMFIGLLTSRYAQEDFVTSLPVKMLFGLITLFLSVAAMMCAFIATLDLMLKGYRRVVIAAMWLALLPILVFVPSLLRLASEISQSTVRFDKLAARKKNNNKD